MIIQTGVELKLPLKQLGEYGCAQIPFKLQEKRGGMEFGTLIGIMNQTTERETCLLN